MYFIDFEVFELNYYPALTMSSLVSLPYFAADIPCRLPTNAEIEAAPLLIEHNQYYDAAL
jgi:hypothetical protein